MNVCIIFWLLAMPAASVGATKATDSQLKNIERAINIEKKQHKSLRKTSSNLGIELHKMKKKMVRLAAAVQEHETIAFDLNVSIKQLRKIEKNKFELANLILLKFENL